MVSERVCSTVLLVLIFNNVISTTSADVAVSENSCSGLSPDTSIGDGCSISDDCSTITCSMNFVNKPITFKLEVNKCDSPVSATASMTVPDLDITWSHTYTSDDIIAVPGFTASVHGLVSAGVYVQVELTDNGDNVHMKVKLLAGGEIFGESSYPVQVTVLDGDLPISTDDCGIFGWWIDLGDFAKVAVIVGPIIFLIIVITCCCCCCGCCGCCRRSNPSNGAIIVAAPAPAVMSTKSTVPMRPLVEEA